MTDQEVQSVEDLLSPKQKKVVNFLFGQAVKANPAARNADPKVLRRIIIERLVVAAHEQTN